MIMVALIIILIPLLACISFILDLRDFVFCVTGRITALPKFIGAKFVSDSNGTISTHLCSSEIVFPEQFQGDYTTFCAVMKLILTVDFNTV